MRVMKEGMIAPPYLARPLVSPSDYLRWKRIAPWRAQTVRRCKADSTDSWALVSFKVILVVVGAGAGAPTEEEGPSRKNPGKKEDCDDGKDCCESPLLERGRS